jgi:hypothetical protein
MEQEPVIYRGEVRAMLFNISDIKGRLDDIIQLLREDDGEEEEEADTEP